MRELRRVAIEGEVWVMAESDADAIQEAAMVRNLADQVEFYVYPMLPVDVNMVDREVIDSIPYNVDRGDRRTVGDHSRAQNAARQAKATTTLATPER